MREVIPHLREVLGRLPQVHPERADVQAMLQLAESLSRRRNGSVESISTLDQLVPQQKEAWKQFLGREIVVPQPPQELLDVWTHAIEQGITVFEAHFLPKTELKQNSKYPGWLVKPKEWFWQKIKEGKVAKDAAKLKGSWVLIDASPKPNYNDGQQLYENDPFAQTIVTLRGKDAIQTPANTPSTSRFKISWDEIHGQVLPEIARLLEVEGKKVRLPKEIEFNIIGNIHHPEWGQTNTWEWFEDSFEADGRLCGGDSSHGGLADVGDDWSGDRSDGIGFRPLVVFPS